MHQILDILSNTPTWVWVVFFYLVFVGIKASKTRIVFIPTLFIAPVVFTGMNYKFFLSSFYILGGYLACLSLSTFLSFHAMKKVKVKYAAQKLSIELPGTFTTMGILLAFFFLKYIFGFMSYANPTLYSDWKFLEVILTGTFTGYLLGKSLRYLYLYLNKKT